MLQFLNYRMFDGEGGGSATGTAGESSGNAESGAVSGAEAGTDQPVQTETKEQQFARLIGKDGEFRDLYKARVNRAVSDRMRASATREQAIRPILDTLAQAYGTDDLAELHQKLRNANELWEAGANESGMTVEQYREMQELRMAQRRFERQRAETQRQIGVNQQLSQWQGEAEQIKQIYPGFDLETEFNNPAFANMVVAGASVQNAYEVIHLNEIKQNTMSYTAEQTERKVMDNIRARGSRPSENGVKGSSGGVKPSNWSRSQRMEAINKVMKKPGMRITFD